MVDRNEDPGRSTWHAGSGPGEQSPDGCSVELYRLLPYMGELDDVWPLLPAGSEVLELGCGTGRLCRPLMEAGCRVTGVDQSAQMLRWLPAGAAAVCGDIETLALPQAFDVVLLASHLIHHPDPSTRAALLASARRHVRPRGRVLVQCHREGWLEAAKPGPAGRAGPVEIHIERAERAGALVHIALRYVAGDAVWRQSFAALPLSPAQVAALLRDAGFSAVTWHGTRALWAGASDI